MSNLRIVVTGANGQVGQELQRVPWPEGTTIRALSSNDLDITDSTSTSRLLTELDPTVIVNAAAYTAVDAAESDEDRATLVNATGVANLATASNRCGAFLIHISTDYVFDGTKTSWYVETDPLNPVGAYGRSKAKGEAHMTLADDSVTLRTAWVYGALGSNFVTTMLRLASERNQIGVVADQVGCPTAATDIARAIVEIVEVHQLQGSLPSRLYHLAAPDQASWFEVAEAVFEASAFGFNGELSALTTEEYPTAALRPANSRLDSTLIYQELGIRLPSWRDSLALVIRELEEN